MVAAVHLSVTMGQTPEQFCAHKKKENNASLQILSGILTTTFVYVSVWKVKATLTHLRFFFYPLAEMKDLTFKNDLICSTSSLQRPFLFYPENPELQRCLLTHPPHVPLLMFHSSFPFLSSPLHFSHLPLVFHFPFDLGNFIILLVGRINRLVLSTAL